MAFPLKERRTGFNTDRALNFGPRSNKLRGPVAFCLKERRTGFNTDRALNFGPRSNKLRDPVAFSLKERRTGKHRSCPQFRAPQQ